MDGENNGKPYFLMGDLGGKPTIFGNIHIISDMSNIVFMMGSSQENESVYGIFWDSVQVVVAHFSSNNPSSTSMVGGETIGSNLEAGMIKQNNPSNYL